MKLWCRAHCLPNHCIIIHFSTLFTSPNWEHLFSFSTEISEQNSRLCAKSAAIRLLKYKCIQISQSLLERPQHLELAAKLCRSFFLFKLQTIGSTNRNCNAIGQRLSRNNRSPDTNISGDLYIVAISHAVRQNLTDFRQFLSLTPWGLFLTEKWNNLPFCCNL